MRSPCTLCSSLQSEVDILGINGVLYKGRVSSQLANRSVSLEKEFSGWLEGQLLWQRVWGRARGSAHRQNTAGATCAFRVEMRR